MTSVKNVAASSILYGTAWASPVGPNGKWPGYFGFDYPPPAWSLVPGHEFNFGGPNRYPFGYLYLFNGSCYPGKS